MFSYTTEPVTDLQKRINVICEQCIEENLKKFCGKQIKRNKDLTVDVKPDKCTTPKEFLLIINILQVKITI